MVPIRMTFHHPTEGRPAVAVVVVPHRHRADRVSVRTHDDDLLRTLVADSR
jgi:hypothetical protein